MTRTDRMTCEEVFQRLDDYLDRELTPDEARMVKEHLDTCAACAAEHRFESPQPRHVDVEDRHLRTQGREAARRVGAEVMFEIAGR